MIDVEELKPPELLAREWSCFAPEKLLSHLTLRASRRLLLFLTVSFRFSLDAREPRYNGLGQKAPCQDSLNTRNKMSTVTTERICRNLPGPRGETHLTISYPTHGFLWAFFELATSFHYVTDTSEEQKYYISVFCAAIFSLEKREELYLSLVAQILEGFKHDWQRSSRNCLVDVPSRTSPQSNGINLTQYHPRASSRTATGQKKSINPYITSWWPSISGRFCDTRSHLPSAGRALSRPSTSVSAACYRKKVLEHEQRLNYKPTATQVENLKNSNKVRC